MTTWTRNALLVSALALVAFGLLIPRRATPEVSWREADWREHPDIISAIRGATALEDRRADLERREERAIARAVIAETRRTGDLTVTADAAVPAETRAHFAAAARRELATAGAVRVPIVVHLAADTVKGQVYNYVRTVVIPRTATAPCGVTVTAPTHRVAQMRLSDEDRLLGACAFYARYGRPSAGMLQWLVATRHASAGYLTAPPTIAGDTTMLSLRQQYRELWTLRGCRAGELSTCATVFSPTREHVEPLLGSMERLRLAAAWEYGDAVAYFPGQVSDTYSRMSHGLLAALAEELGPARFEALWSSADGPETAYERAEGRPVTQWLVARAERIVEPYRRGPAVPLVPWAIGLALLVAAWWGSARLTSRAMS